MHHKKLALTLSFFTALAGAAEAQSGPLADQAPAPAAMAAYRPSHAEILDRYRQAALMDSVAKNTVFKTGVQAHWQAGGRSFWYRNFLKDSTAEYIYVDAATGKKQPAFDATRLAGALAKASGKPVDGSRLRLSDLAFEGKAITFRLNDQYWKCDLTTYACSALDRPVEADDDRPGRRGAYGSGFRPYSRWNLNYIKGDSVSPNQQWVAFIKDHDVYLRPKAGGAEQRFTTDGTKERPYGSIIWSPDSKYFLGYRIDPREQKEVYYVLSSVANTTRGQLKSQRYAQPGDEFTSYEMFVFSLQGGKPLKVQTEKHDFLGMPYPRWRPSDNRYFTYEKADRGHQRFRIIEVDALTGATRNIVEEKTNTFIYEQRIFTHYLQNTNEIVWLTEKDGWRQLYLVDGLSAAIKPITKGEWVVRNVDSVDEKKREVWFSASGRNPGEDPYNVHYYRVGLDGKGLVELTPAEGHHQVTFSPDRKYFVDTYSQPHVAPVTELRRTADGKLVMQLEKADISAYLATGIRLPEVFRAKGRDGQTDIWGVVCRPRNFDPQKRYPVIENIYAGPQDAFVPKSFMSYGEMQSLAELGFIVVQSDGMGTANRSKAFHDVCWKNLADAGFPDRIAWIRALADKYPYVDTSRVGLYGTSAGGQNAMGGLLFHPEFYKAAVSACGCHDNRIDKQWWNEQWMGYPVASHYDEQSNITNAHKLQGQVLLIVGEADTNVPPESTYRLADALIQSGKSFDFLTVPGMGHGDGGPYGRKKKRDFFVKNLLAVDPPNRNSNEL
ncbi:DPP IV N-terminal domain-containing protein [Paraflavisolibacter sp. H34]|uniref:S9 family peptidase n=1 Tax=Huijunlia imazamoxiresistens TaxID=3127457 RepID=UPI003016509D